MKVILVQNFDSMLCVMKKMVFYKLEVAELN